MTRPGDRPRRVPQLQLAAQLLVGELRPRVDTMRAEAESAEAAVKRSTRTGHDARADAKELAFLMRGRADGADLLLRYIGSIATGRTIVGDLYKSAPC